jgi:protein gp37
MTAKHRPGKWWDFNVNFFYGCQLVSAGCEHCWAAAMAVDWKKRTTLPQYQGLITLSAAIPLPVFPYRTESRPRWNGQIREVEKVRGLDDLAKCSGLIVTLEFLGDICYPEDPRYLQAGVGLALQHPQHHFVLVTKRPERLRSPGALEALHDQQNLEVMVSVENQATADQRIGTLLSLDALHPGVCYEPALGPWDPEQSIPIGKRGPGDGGIEWIVMGAESGYKPRAFKREWAETVLAFCQAYNVPLYYKYGENDLCTFENLPRLHGEQRHAFPPWMKPPRQTPNTATPNAALEKAPC